MPAPALRWPESGSATSFKSGRLGSTPSPATVLENYQLNVDLHTTGEVILDSTDSPRAEDTFTQAMTEIPQPRLRRLG